MWTHMKMLTINIVNKIKIFWYKCSYKYNSIPADEFFNQFDGGNLKKRGGHIITGARQKEEYSRRDAAIALGINPKELKAIEKGLKQPSKKLVIKMAQVYNTSLNILWKYAI